MTDQPQEVWHEDLNEEDLEELQEQLRQIRDDEADGKVVGH